MKKEDFEDIKKSAEGTEIWTDNQGLKRVPNGCLIMFYDGKTDSITSSAFIPLNN